MSSFLSCLANVLFLLAMGFLVTISITAMANLFVQEFIDRHERLHHRRSSERPQTTDGE
jgi:hypothetical protein